MKKILCKVRQNLFGFILGAIIFTTIGVYAATQIISSQVTYKDNKSVQDAIDDLYRKVDNSVILKKCNENNCKKCIRATYLHTEICNQIDDTYYCTGAGYTTGSTITYGNLGTKGILTPGDAFDCDINGDGIYDAMSERFYYVVTSNGVVTLIYYNNTSGGTANNTTTYAYYSSAKENWHGPVTAIAQLPTTSQWSNISLKNTERAILNETGGTTTTGGSLPTNFSYSGYAARLLTVQEVNVACNIIVGSYPIGELDNCQYLMENTKFSNGFLSYGYWLENSLLKRYDSATLISGFQRHSGFITISDTSVVGVRPAIEVSISDIEY